MRWRAIGGRVVSLNTKLGIGGPEVHAYQAISGRHAGTVAGVPAALVAPLMVTKPCDPAGELM